MATTYIGVTVDQPFQEEIVCWKLASLFPRAELRQMRSPEGKSMIAAAIEACDGIAPEEDEVCHKAIEKIENMFRRPAVFAEADRF